MEKISVLFVCTANICRSPMAQAVFAHHAAQAGYATQLIIESAGTHVGRSGDPPDARAKRAAAMRGYDMSRCRTRAVHNKDFERFDYVLAMEQRNLDVLSQDCPLEHGGKLQLLMTYGAAGEARSVPDPYYGGMPGFERVLDMVEDAAQGLLRHIRQRHFL
ncbi:MAG: low molecular weight phosphotyrosine protein phosphatase [Betaproteobacteria bacterium]|nr:low molecular weight phosphotyrosine protein phosphatase [Betaproteobacteria bacterium]